MSYDIDLEREAEMFALDEEAEAPQLDHADFVVPRTDPTHRRLRAIAGAGVPYVFVTIGKQVGVDFQGVLPENVPALLRELADVIEKPAA